MQPVYEIHSRTGTPLLSFDREDRAKQELARRGLTGARIYKVTRHMEEVK